MSRRADPDPAIDEINAMLDELESTRSPPATPQRQPMPGEMAFGSKFDSNDENLAAWRSGELKHEPPVFEWFNPTKREVLPVHIKEIKLPLAEQTHEVVYEPVTNCCYVSQMSNSVLVRIPLDDEGFLLDDQDAWRLGDKDPKTGKGIEGLHNVSLSQANPGHLWVSMQYSNELFLIDVRPKHNLRIRQILQVPTHYRDPETDEIIHVGGPHCMRECPVTGDIWAGLKGALKDSPCWDAVREGKSPSSCCNPVELDHNMNMLREIYGRDTPIPDGWAVWQVSLDKYNPSAPDGAKGGVLYPCCKSPPMIDFDAAGNAYIPQDGVDKMMYINRATGVTEQLPIPFPSEKPDPAFADQVNAFGSDPRIAGPAVKTAPDGSVWISQLGSYNALVRIDPDDNNKRTLYNFGGDSWATKLRLIHIAFSAAGTCDRKHNTIFALASDLLDCSSLDAVVILRMDQDWKKCLGRRIIPLPTQNCAAHRVAFIDSGIEGRPDLSQSIVVTELAASKLLQIKTHHIGDFSALVEHIHIDGFTGCEIRTYNSCGVMPDAEELTKEHDSTETAASWRGKLTIPDKAKFLSTLNLGK